MFEALSEYTVYPIDQFQTAKSTKAYIEFWDLIRPNSIRYSRLIDVVGEVTINKAQRELNQNKLEDLLLQRLLDINPEGELPKEIKDIQDELNMITKVFTEQQVVVQEFLIYIQQLAGRSTEVTQKTKNETLRLKNEISRRKAEVAELTKAAERTAKGVSKIFSSLAQANLLR
jgi:hypothetical protein